MRIRAGQMAIKRAVRAFIGGELQRHMGGFRHAIRPSAHQNSQPSLTQNGVQDFRAVFTE